VPTRRDAQYFVGEKFERRAIVPEQAAKRQMSGHICAVARCAVSGFVSEKWTARDSSAGVELKKLSASGSALATETPSGCSSELSVALACMQ
jgi:hypothetical protein